MNRLEQHKTMRLDRNNTKSFSYLVWVSNEKVRKMSNKRTLEKNEVHIFKISNNMWSYHKKFK